MCPKWKIFSSFNFVYFNNKEIKNSLFCEKNKNNNYYNQYYYICKKHLWISSKSFDYAKMNKIHSNSEPK